MLIYALHAFIFLCTNKFGSVQNIYTECISRMSRSLPLLVFILLSYIVANLFLRCSVNIDFKQIRTFFWNVSKYNQNRYILNVSVGSQNLMIIIIIIILIFMHSFYITICLNCFCLKLYLYCLIKRTKTSLIVIRGIYQSYYAHLPIDMFIRL